MEVIAEIGKNFVNQEEPQPLPVLLANAKHLIDEAVKAKVDTVKFQVHNVSDEIVPDIKIRAPHFDQDRYEWVKRNTYPVEFWHELNQYCREVGVDFLATPMSRGAAEILDEVGVDRWKIGSADITDFVLLDYVRDTGKPVILSSGMSTLEELKTAYDYVAEKVVDITILHCVSMYPCPVEKLNLATIWFLKVQFPQAKIGFSDHSVGIEGPLMALSLGAEVIEKHFTLDRKSWGPDHKVSLEPEELRELMARVRDRDWIRSTDEALGTETKFLRQEESQYRPSFRKGLYCARDIESTELWHPDMMVALRPKLPNARPASEYPDFLGKFTGTTYKQNDPV